MVRRVNAREKFWMKKVCVNVCGLWVESYLLAMMRYAAYLSFKHLGCIKAIRPNRFKVRRFDCSFIVTCPVQTSVGKLNLD